MRQLILAAAALTGIALTTAAYAEPMCWAWVMKGNDLTCELRGPSTSGQADATAREAQRRNNLGPSYHSITTSVDGDGKITGTTTSTTTFPRYR